MLKDELLLITRLEDYRILIETLDSSRKFHAAHQVNREKSLVLAGVV